jgi:DNA-3-methyladenine glycosylase I
MEKSQMAKLNFCIRQLDPSNNNWVAQFISERWGAELIVAHGEVYYPHELPGFVAIQGEEKIGLTTYIIRQRNCEIISLDSLQPSIGIGSALIDAVKTVALQSQCRRIWLTTTNDNLNALRFYQKRGFVLVKVHRNAVEIVRKHKAIPLIAANGIPIRDEIELEMILEKG